MNSFKFSDKIATLLLFILTLCYYHRIIFFGEILYYGDNLSLIAPLKSFAAELTKQGTLPLWNPYSFAGTPLFGDINNGLLSPFNIFYFITSPLRAVSIIVWIETFLTGLFMYLYLKQIRISYLPRLTAAVIWMFSGTLMQLSTNAAAFDVIIWIPLVLLFIELYFQNLNKIFIIFATVIISFQLCAGHLQFAYYSLLLYFSYLFFYSRQSFKQKLSTFALMFVFSVGLSAIQLLPFLELTQFSNRPHHDYFFATEGSLSPLYIIQIFFINLFGVLRAGTSWGLTAQTLGYIGVIPLILIAIYLRNNRRKQSLFWLISSLVAFILALGKYTPLFYLPFAVVPFFDRFRSPGGLIIIYTLGMTVLSAMAVEYYFLLLKNHNQKLLSHLKLVLIFVYIIFIFAAILKLFGFNYFIQILNHLKYIPAINHFAHYPLIRLTIIYKTWINNLLVVLVFIFAYAGISYIYLKKKLVLPAAQLLLITILVGDVIFFARNTTVISPQTFPADKNVTAFLQKKVGSQRIYTILESGTNKPLFGDAEQFKKETLKSYLSYKPDLNVPFHLASIDGYTSVVMKDYAKYVLGDQPAFMTSIPTPNITERQLDELGVRYIITTGEFGDVLTRSPKHRFVSKYYSEYLHKIFYIFENKAAYPRAYVITNGDEIVPVKIVKFGANEVTLNLPQNRAGRLVLSDIVYPGWKAYIDGKEVGINKYKNIFLSMDIKNNKEVKFEYRPLSVYIGVVISLITLFMAVIYASTNKTWNIEHIRFAQCKHKTA